MSGARDGIRLAVAAAATCVALYFPQPLIARIQEDFGVAAVWAAMPMTFAFVVLTSGPILFSRFITLERAMRLIVGIELVLALLFAVQAFTQSPTAYFVLRGMQVLLLPLLIPAIITSSSNLASSTSRARDLALYTAGTIVGGVAGRLFALASASFEHWQLGGLAATAALLVSVFVLRNPPALTNIVKASAPPSETPDATPAPVRDHDKPWLAPVSLAFPGLAMAFSTLTAILTVLPLKIGYAGDGTRTLTLVYAGYAAGIVTSLGAPAATRWAGGLPNATAVAGVVFFAGLLGVIWGGEVALAVGVVAMCAAMVFQQATQIVLLNDFFSRRQSATVSALFVAAVFAGGIVGSSALVVLYEWFGWAAVCGVCLVFALAGGVCMAIAARWPAGRSS
ncbi:MAG: MFS transporter [Salinisphaera sp.]|nr:MFS transporter [Salinisphaera sp.]